MCNILMFSTNAPKELIPNELEGLFFVADLPKEETTNLQYEHSYRVATITPDNCSCGFRIFGDDFGQSVGFCPPQDWLDETDTDEDIINTRIFFEFIKTLVGQGFLVDSYVGWNDGKEQAKYQQVVSIQEIKTEAFALFENYRFVYQ